MGTASPALGTTPVNMPSSRTARQIDRGCHRIVVLLRYKCKMRSQAHSYNTNIGRRHHCSDVVKPADVIRLMDLSIVKRRNMPRDETAFINHRIDLTSQLYW